LGGWLIFLFDANDYFTIDKSSNSREGKIMHSLQAYFKISVSHSWRSFRMVWLMVASVLAGFAQNTLAQHVANPFVGAKQYINPDYATKINSVIAQTSDATLVSQMKTVQSYPTAVWLDSMKSIAGGAANDGRLSLAQHINAALQQQAGGSQPIVLTLVIYDLPDRDCAALASNGEISIAANPPTQPLSGIDTYKQNYITPIVNTLQAYSTNPLIRFVLVVEADSIPNLVTNTAGATSIPSCVAAQTSRVYVDGIAYAITQFHQLQNVYQYLDVGQSAWLGWPSNFSPAITLYHDLVSATQSGLSTIDGFISNTANYADAREPFMSATQQVGSGQVYSANFFQYNPYIDEGSYEAALYAAFVNAGFPASIGILMDTSRNGWGGANRPSGASTSTDLNTFVDATRIDRRNHRGQWCNQSGAGMGVPPMANPPGFFPQLQAFVWIKPPGESDGTYATSTGYVGGNADENCNPAHHNALAGNTLTGAMPNAPSAGVFFPAQFIQLIRGAYPAIPASSGGGGTPGFTLAPAVSSLSVVRGNSTADGISVGRLGGFTGAVTLSVAGLPSGVTAVFGTNPTSGDSVLTLSASSSAAAGKSTLTITGNSGTLSATTTLSLTVGVAQTPAFTLGASPPSVSLTQGGSTTDTVRVTGAGGFSGNVTLSATGLPSGVTASFSPNPTAGASLVTFTAGSNAVAGTSTVTINGTSGTLASSTPLSLTVNSANTGGFACHVGYSVSSQWPGGFGASLSIANTGTTALSSWKLSWSFANGQTVTQLWNGNVTQSGSQVAVTSLSYNGSIPPGSTYSGVGFNGSWNSTINAVPTSFAVNGTPCR
jgi:cellulose 1,4-beta-cellobiosidase